MGKVIKFPTHRCRKPSTKDWYTSDKSGWTSNEEMLMRAIADIVTGRVKCKGAALILYHKSCTTVYRRKPLVIELHPHYVVMRHKGQRMGVAVDYAAIYELGYKLLAQAEPKKGRRK